MDPSKLYFDSRLLGCCVFCGGRTESRDHCPSKVLLDDPLPPQLPVVDACHTCNNGFSLDEQYVACLIECVICGSVAIDSLIRPKIKRILADRPELANQIAKGRRQNEENGIEWQVELNRIENVALKLARGHMAFEHCLLKLEAPVAVELTPLVNFSEQQRSCFESTYVEGRTLWPEIGSRAFERALQAGSTEENWIVVQEGRYRYLASSQLDIVKIVISEYLGCTVRWGEQ